MFTRTPDGVLISLSNEQYTELMMALGAAAANPNMVWVSLRVANAINDGNPNWTPYIVGPDNRAGWKG